MSASLRSATTKEATRLELQAIAARHPELDALRHPQPDEPEYVEPIRLRPPPSPYVVLPIAMPQVPGALYASRVPGRLREQTRDDLRALQRFGIQRIVCLVETEQLVQAHGADLYLPLGRAAYGDAFHHLQVRDHDIPEDDAAFERCTRTVHEALLRGERVLVHCIAGCGRTGMFVACLLCHQGLSALEAIRAFRRCRRCGPDTTEQMAYAIRYADKLAAGR